MKLVPKFNLQYIVEQQMNQRVPPSHEPGCRVQPLPSFKVKFQFTDKYELIRDAYFEPDDLRGIVYQFEYIEAESSKEQSLRWGIKYIPHISLSTQCKLFREDEIDAD